MSTKRVLNLFLIVFISLLFLTGCEKGVGHFVKTGELNQVRTKHSAVLLKNGNVLVTGGDYGWNIWNSAEIYLTKEGRFIRTGNMIKKRYNHSSILLPDERVVILGGTSPADVSKDVYDKNGYLRSGALTSSVIEIYNPNTGRFESGGNLIQKVSVPKTVLMKDGRIFIMGGVDPKDGIFSGYAEIYDPKTKTSKLTSQMNYARCNFDLTLLKDGRILITGGDLSPKTKGRFDYTLKPFKINGIRHIGGPTSTAEVYNPLTDKFILLNMNYKRTKHITTLLPDGNVLILGGSLSYEYGSFLDKKVYERNVHNSVKQSFRYGDIRGDIQDIELFNPKTNKFKVVGKLNYAMNAAQLNLINNKYVLATGGIGKTEELIDIKTFKTIPTNKMIVKRGMHTATNIDNNRVLIVGGFFYKNITKNTAEIFELSK